MDALAPGGGSGFPGGGKAVVEDKVETVEGERHMRIRGFVWMGHFTLSSGGGYFFNELFEVCKRGLSQNTFFSNLPAGMNSIFALTKPQSQRVPRVFLLDPWPSKHLLHPWLQHLPHL